MNPTRRKTSRPKRYSLRHHLLLGSFAVFLLFVFITVGGSAYFSAVIREQTVAGMKGTMQLYARQTEQELDTLERYLYGLVTNSSNITIVDENRRDTNHYIAIRGIQSSLENILPCFPNVDGLFVYSVKADTFINYTTNASGSAGVLYFQKYLRDAVAQPKPWDVTTMQWSSCRISGKLVFYKIIPVGQSFAGAWVSGDDLLDLFGGIDELDNRTVFLSPEGTVLDDSVDAAAADDAVPRFPGMRIDISSARDGSRMLKDTDGGHWLMIANPLSVLNVQLLSLVPEKALYARLNQTRAVLLVIGAMTLGLGVSLTLLLNRYLDRPIRSLLVAIQSLRAGSFDTMVETGDTECEEFVQVNNAFNDMVGRIHELKIGIYEQQLERKGMELKYLQAQIAPHFLINCLNTIYYLSAKPENHDVIHRMTSALSGHLRYTLSTRKRVRLSEEMDLVANYLELTGLRFPDCLRYHPDIRSGVEDAAIFPMVALMFVENAVKHELVMGRELHVWVRAERTEPDGNVRLTMIDSGDGFPEDFLRRLREQPAETAEEDQHIGIQNVIRRLRMEYGDSASIAFSNEPDAGARIDIVIPYLSYDEEMMRLRREARANGETAVAAEEGAIG